MILRYVPIRPYTMRCPNASYNQSSSRSVLVLTAVSLATVLYQLIPSSYTIFAPCDSAFEHYASMGVIEMSL
jgi:uncharacterized surface protein with fasciclin (FAS1) repeats